MKIAEFRARGESLKWSKRGAVKEERAVTFEQVMNQYKKTHRRKQLYETIDRLIFREAGSPSWWEGVRG